MQELLFQEAMCILATMVAISLSIIHCTGYLYINTFLKQLLCECRWVACSICTVYINTFLELLLFECRWVACSICTVYIIGTDVV